jgi:hypothetical protein
LDSIFQDDNPLDRKFLDDNPLDSIFQDDNPLDRKFLDDNSLGSILLDENLSTQRAAKMKEAFQRHILG